ncbi:uncharacterized protein LOC144114260 [Amblyomma americanum]
MSCDRGIRKSTRTREIPYVVRGQAYGNDGQEKTECIEDQELLSTTMFCLRARLSAHDVLLQLNREVIGPLYGSQRDRAIFALYLKGTFDNVKRSKTQENLNTTNCGKRTYRYVKDFLMDRKAYIRTYDSKLGPIEMGTRGTPQGAVMSPLLFYIAMMDLPGRLNAINGVRHGIYADDITLWSSSGSIGQIEDALQEAASAVHKYAEECGLRCAPTK